MDQPTLSDVRTFLEKLPLPGYPSLYFDETSGHSLQQDQESFLLILNVPSEVEAESLRQLIEKEFAKVFKTTSLKILLTKHRKAIAKKQVIAVASGKGGVGKSTTTLLLALGLLEKGLSVGILDADIYGPSLPTLMNCFDKPSATEDKKIIPHHHHGLTWLSIGSLIPQETPLIWRGPMVQGALMQLLNDVIWEAYGPLDVLLIDTPPGTGDVHLTLAQKAGLTGAVIVSTPQDLALIDARKGIKMFEKVNVPILGLVENMSVFHCPTCGTDHSLFGDGGAQEAKRQNIPFLGQIPLHPALRAACDVGEAHTLEKSIKQAYDPLVTTVYAYIASQK